MPGSHHGGISAPSAFMNSYPSRLGPLFPLFFLAAFFVAALFFFTRENRFAFFYHPDEPGKVEQVQTAQWNFHHPVFMLTTARAAAKATLSPAEMENKQQVVEMGRFVSAAFTAGAATFLAGTLWLIAGPFAAAAAALLLATNHQLFELAHYFKEDTSLLFGTAVWFFALTLHAKRRTLGSAALVGAGAALAVSAKYIGAFAPVLSLFLVPLAAPKGKRLAALAAFVVTLAGVVSVVNLPLLRNLAGFEHGFDREIKLVVDGQGKTTRSVPHSVYWTAFQQNVIFFLWPLLAWFYFTCWKRRKTLSVAEWTLALFPIAFLVVLSFSPKTNDRYFLPATALFLCGAALGLNALRPLLPKRVPALALLGIVTLPQLPDLVEYYRAFRHDDVRELSEWLNRELPDAKIAIDRKVLLPNPRQDEYHPYQVPLKAEVMRGNVESFRTVRALREAGITHVVLSESAYGRYFDDDLRPQRGAEKSHSEKTQLYESLLSGKKPLWERERNKVIYLHPGLRVHALPEP